jgi:hypothetical protein
MLFRLATAFAALSLALALAVPASAKEACALVNKNDVGRAFGEAFKDGESIVTSKAGGGRPEVSQCSFDALNRTETGAHRVSVMARISSEPDPEAFAQVRQALATADQSRPQTVNGVGDTALWVVRSVGAVSVAQLNVFKAGTIYLIVSVDTGSRAPSMRDRSKALAAVALYRLGK